MPKIPKMVDLPLVRLKHHNRPFSFTEMYFFGSIEVTGKRRKEERYGDLFACLTTRAVHLEIAHSLSTDSAIMAIRRLIAPIEIWSDNWTNLRRAERELRNALENFNQEEIFNKCILHKIKWNFIPSLAPHMGGVGKV